MTTSISSATLEEHLFIERICRQSDHESLWMLWSLWHLSVAVLSIGVPIIHLTADPESVAGCVSVIWLLPVLFAMHFLPGTLLNRFRHRKDRALQQLVVYDGNVERIRVNRKNETRFQLRAVDLDRNIVSTKIVADGVQVKEETWDQFDDKPRARLEFLLGSRHIYMIDGDFIEPLESWPLRFNQRRIAILFASIAVLIAVHTASAKLGITIGIAWVVFLALRFESVPTEERL